MSGVTYGVIDLMAIIVVVAAADAVSIVRTKGRLTLNNLC